MLPFAAAHAPNNEEGEALSGWLPFESPPVSGFSDPSGESASPPAPSWPSPAPSVDWSPAESSPSGCCAHGGNSPGLSFGPGYDEEVPMCSSYPLFSKVLAAAVANRLLVSLLAHRRPKAWSGVSPSVPPHTFFNRGGAEKGMADSGRDSNKATNCAANSGRPCTRASRPGNADPSPSSFSSARTRLARSPKTAAASQLA